MKRLYNSIKANCNGFVVRIMLFGIFGLLTTANLAQAQAVCGTSTTVTGRSSLPSAQSSGWSVLEGAGGSFSNGSNRSATFSGQTGILYRIAWNEQHPSYGFHRDIQTVVFYDAPTAAAAGPDQTVRYQATLAGNTPVAFDQGTWSVVSGAGGSFSDVNSPTATFTGTPGVTYTLRWTISNVACSPDSQDDVVITVSPNNAPVFTSSESTLVDDNATYYYTITATDADNDELTYTAPTKPGWLNFNAIKVGDVSTIAGSGTEAKTAG